MPPRISGGFGTGPGTAGAKPKEKSQDRNHPSHELGRRRSFGLHHGSLVDKHQSSSICMKEQRKTPGLIRVGSISGPASWNNWLGAKSPDGDLIRSQTRDSFQSVFVRRKTPAFGFAFWGTEASCTVLIMARMFPSGVPACTLWQEQQMKPSRPAPKVSRQ